uniref:Uncharacterized protein n=1 Tax=Zonotrichia albicollis TaxID=44394 RepID=A0A8D2MV05_ZONAL
MQQPLRDRTPCQLLSCHRAPRRGRTAKCLGRFPLRCPLRCPVRCPARCPARQRAQPQGWHPQEGSSRTGHRAGSTTRSISPWPSPNP